MNLMRVIAQTNLKFRICLFATASFVFYSAFPTVALAQDNGDTASLKRQVEELKQGQNEIRKELADIKAMLTPMQSPVPTSIAIGAGDTPFRGTKTARVTLIEYFDYQCPFCDSFFNETMSQVVADYISKGKLTYIARDFPLEAEHPDALVAAEAAHCANDQGKFWRMHDELMGNSDALQRPKLSLYARDAGLDIGSFDKCVDSGKYAAVIKQSMETGTKLGVEGTPTFFLGIADASGDKIESVQRLEGAIPYSQLKDAIDHLLVQTTQPATSAGSH